MRAWTGSEAWLISSTYAVATAADQVAAARIVDDEEETRRGGEPLERAQPARLYALAAGGLLALLGALGFFYASDFGTGGDLASDDLAGILLLNGWRNLIYLVAGVLALALAPRRPREVALALGGFLVVLAIWGFAVTDRGIGSILDALPTADRDNALHLLLGILGLAAAVAEGGFRGGGPRSARAARRRSPAVPRGGAGDEPR